MIEYRRQTMVLLVTMLMAMPGGCDDGSGGLGSVEEREWSLSINDGYGMPRNAMTADSEGNVYMSAIFRKGATVCGKVLNEDNNGIYLMKVDVHGICLWVKSFCTENSIGEIVDIAVDSSGNPVITGSFNGSISFGGEALGDPELSSSNAYLAKLTPDGDHLWSSWYEGSGDAWYSSEVVIAPDDTIHLVGYNNGSMSFGGEVLSSQGEKDVFVASFTSDGGHIRSQRFGNESNEVARAVAVDSRGALYVAGEYGHGLNLCGTDLGEHGSSDVFLMKLTPQGDCAWVKSFGSDGLDFNHALAVDAQDNLYLAGSVGGSIDMGGGALACGGKGDILVASYTSGGVHRWSNCAGDDNMQGATGIAVGTQGDIWLAGSYEGSIRWDDATEMRSGGSDVFITRLMASDGSHVQSLSFGSPNLPDHVTCLSTDPSGHLFASGRYATDFSIEYGMTAYSFLWCFDTAP